jgi:broad specificity phosphatase PhoE
MTAIHWARHGENVANLSGTFSCRIFDGDLTDRGIVQAQRLADRLHAASDRYGLLVCSPLRRARQTAQIVSARLGLPVAVELDDLREVNVGELDGRAGDSAWRVYEATLAAWRCGRPSGSPAASPAASWQRAPGAPLGASQPGRAAWTLSLSHMARASGPPCQRSPGSQTPAAIWRPGMWPGSQSPAATG